MIKKASYRVIRVCYFALNFFFFFLIIYLNYLFCYVGGPLNKSMHVISFTLQGVVKINRNYNFGSMCESCSEILWKVFYQI